MEECRHKNAYRLATKLGQDISKIGTTKMLRTRLEKLQRMTSNITDLTSPKASAAEVMDAAGITWKFEPA